MALGFGEQANQGLPPSPGVALEVRVELLSDGKPRVQREGAPSASGSRLAVGRAIDVFADHPVAAAKVRPGRCEVIEREAPLVHVAGAHQPFMARRNSSARR